MPLELPPFADPKHVNRRLHQAALYLVAWETLRSAVLDRVKGFFTDGWTRDESRKMAAQTSLEYKEQVFSKNPRDEFHAACLWLVEHHALDEGDLEIISLARKHRNEIAHEIVGFITMFDRDVSRELLHGIYGVVKKHDIWWLTEVDMAIQDSWTEDDYKVAREGKAIGGYSMLLELILPIFDH
ncbi:MAG: hypothetical protein NTW91_09410 [Verrucomicrobia bacterium]|nr:hypothetical protein [Verrucomicrobiota bacterium]